MSTILTILVVAVFLALAGGVGYLWLRLNETSRREALQALAARRGWALTIVEERLGRPGVLRIAPRGGSGWTVETRRSATPSEPQHRKAQVTEFLAPEPHWADGLLILGPALPEGHDAAALAQGMDTPEGRRLIAAMAGPGFAGYAPVLRLWPAPPAITVLASSEPVPRFDLGDLAKLHAGWAGDAHGGPVIVLGRDGLRVHMATGLNRADRMEHFIDFALEAARIL